MSQFETWDVTKARADKTDLPGVLRGLFGSDFQPASVDQDRFENTDFVCSVLPNVRVSARVRGWEYTKNLIYKWNPGLAYNVTIRWTRPSGRISELPKWHEGHGTHQLYCFEGEPLVDGDQLVPSGKVYMWILLDLEEVRKSWTEDWVIEWYTNRDGSSTFKVLDLNKVPDTCLLASSPNHPLSARCVGLTT